MQKRAKKLPIGELLRLACIYAERDQLAYIDAWGDCGEDDSVMEAKAFIKQLRKYRIKRWGSTQLERALQQAEMVRVSELLDRLQEGNGNANPPG